DDTATGNQAGLMGFARPHPVVDYGFRLQRPRSLPPKHQRDQTSISPELRPDSVRGTMIDSTLDMAIRSIVRILTPYLSAIILFASPFVIAFRAADRCFGDRID